MAHVEHKYGRIAKPFVTRGHDWESPTPHPPPSLGAAGEGEQAARTEISNEGVGGDDRQRGQPYLKA